MKWELHSDGSNGSIGTYYTSQMCTPCLNNTFIFLLLL
jgi:hypothetical protein